MEYYFAIKNQASLLMCLTCCLLTFWLDRLKAGLSAEDLWCPRLSGTWTGQNQQSVALRMRYTLFILSFTAYYTLK